MCRKAVNQSIMNKDLCGSDHFPIIAKFLSTKRVEDMPNVKTVLSAV